MEIDKETFIQNLYLTQFYCEQKIQDKSKSIAKILRSLYLEYKDKDIFGFEWNKKYKIELTKWNFEILDNNFQIVSELFEQQLIRKKQSIELYENKNFRGKIFVSEFGCTVTDGASEIESKGLIDVYDLPPIDTWFYILKKNNTQNIFAWIPERFEREANSAIEVNCVDILSWLNNWDKDLFNNFEKIKKAEANNDYNRNTP